MRKIALLDIDDILMPFIEGFNKYLVTVRRDLRIKPNYLPKTWGFKELGNVDKEIQYYINNLADKYRIFEGATDFTEELKKLGFEVILITAHPSQHLLKRIRNLKGQGLPFDHIYSVASFTPEGERIRESKIEFTEALELDKDSIILFADDRADATIDMVAKFKNLQGFTLNRDYNSEELSMVKMFDEDAKRFNVISNPGVGADEQVKELYTHFLEKARGI